VIPLRNHEGEIIGVLQLINKLDEGNKVVSFDEGDKITALSLASQAAMAITNRILIKGLEDLLMAFIEAIAKAIDAKSPYTGGHVRKVAEIALDIATAISEDDERYPNIKFSKDELQQFRIAGMMHDIGKISTPVHIVDKSTKLEAIHDRIECVVLKCELLKAQHPEEAEKIDSDIEFLKSINRGGEFMADALIERLHSIAEQKVIIGGVEHNLLDENEVYNLSIKKGTLTKEDREIINGHALLSVQMLETLPFPKKLVRVPEIAGNHHEQPGGNGYPRGLKGDELSFESRIMAIADIFEALTASDRPYKEGKKLSECFKILSFMAKDNEIDSNLLKFYYESGLYLKFAKSNLKDYQIDEVPPLKI
jgi:HD-GYP domain-containing protein (c-di-GMP phosphodiesterase class II)